mgnify:CR=1 FL=1
MTGDSLVRKFVFYTDDDVLRFTAFMRANRKPMAEQQRFLQAVVSEYKATRSNEQNAYMWAGLLEPTSEQAWAAGKRLSPEGWNLVLKIMFLPETCAKGVSKWFYAPDGERTLSMSTSDLNVDEMRLYLDSCAAYVNSDLGVQLPQNPRDRA